MNSTSTLLSHSTQFYCNACGGCPRVALPLEEPVGYECHRFSKIPNDGPDKNEYDFRQNRRQHVGINALQRTETSSDQTNHESSVEVSVSSGLPQEAVLTQPFNGATDIGLAPTFQWDAGAGSLQWHIQVSSSPDESGIVYENQSIESTSFQIPVMLETNTPYFWRVSASNNCGNSSWTEWWSFRTTDAMTVLLVDDDDNSPNVLSSYTDLLDSAGMLYEVFDTANSNNEPDLNTLQAYPLVIWFTGDEWGGFAGPGSPGEAALGSYIEAGGHLLLSSQDYLYDNGLTSFGDTYLGIASFNSDVNQSTVTGEDIFDSIGSVSLSFPFSNWSDEVNPASEAFLTFDGSSGNAAVRKDGEHGGSALFFGFPIITLPEESQSLLIAEVMNWVGDTPEPCPADCNGDGFVNVSDLLSIIEAWGTSAGCDINADGIIDVVDLLAAVGAWGACP